MFTNAFQTKAWPGYGRSGRGVSNGAIDARSPACLLFVLRPFNGCRYLTGLSRLITPFG